MCLAGQPSTRAPETLVKSALIRRPAPQGPRPDGILLTVHPALSVMGRDPDRTQRMPTR